MKVQDLLWGRSESFLHPPFLRFLQSEINIQDAKAPYLGAYVLNSMRLLPIILPPKVKMCIYPNSSQALTFHVPRKYQNNMGEGGSTQGCQLYVLSNKHIKNNSYDHYQIIFKMTC